MSEALAAILNRVSELYEKKDEAAAKLSEINKQIKEVERIAVEQLAASGLDGVRAAGKSWHLREAWQVTIPADKKEEIVKAAVSAGLDDYVTVNTTSLKSWLTYRRKETGSRSESLASGTPFDGLISEFRETRLSRQTLS